MVELAPGMRVRTRTADPDGHTRLPRYARGERLGCHGIPDSRFIALDGILLYQ